MKYLEILVKLRKIIRSINLESKRIEKQFGISIPQLLTLQFLSEQPGYRASSKDIKVYLNLNASTTSGIISRLESKGMVARLSRQDDKRASYITLTARGFELMKESPVTLQEKLSERLRELPPHKIEELDRNIELLIDIMDAKGMDAAPMITIDEIKSDNI